MPDVCEDNEADVGERDGQDGAEGAGGRFHQAGAAAQFDAGNCEEEVDEREGEGVVEGEALEQRLVAQHYEHAARHVHGSQSGGAGGRHAARGSGGSNVNGD